MGGSPVPSQTIEYGATVDEPTPAPTKAGYKLVGWNDEFGQPWNFKTDTVKGDMTLFANWEAEEFSIEYKAEGLGERGTEQWEKVTLANPESYTKDTPAFYLTNPNANEVPDGYTFEGWREEGTTKVIENFYIDPAKMTKLENKTYYAVFNPIVWHITYDMDHGKWAEGDINKVVYQYTVEGAIVDGKLAGTFKICNPVQEGMDFVGWTLDGETGVEPVKDYEIDPSDAKFRRNITLHAHFTGAILTVTFEVPEWCKDAGTIVCDDLKQPMEVEVNYGATFHWEKTDAIQITDKDGVTRNWYPVASEDTAQYSYEFLTWAWTPVSLNNVIREDTVIYATFLETTNVYNVDFVTGFEPDVTVESQDVEYGALVTRPEAPARNGYIFEGWFTDETFTTPWYFNFDTIVGDTTLYAK